MSQKLTTLLFIGSVLYLPIGESANILCIFPTPSISHQMIPRALMKALANRGHNITLFTTDPFETNLTNVEQHSLKWAYLELNNNFNMAKIKEMDVSLVEVLNDVTRTIMGVTALEMKDPAIAELIASSRKFDVVIVESWWVSPFFAFAKHFNAPLIGIATLDAPSFINKAVGNFIHPVIYPNFFLHGENLYFLQRVKAVLVEIYYRVSINSKASKACNEMIDQYFGKNMDRCEVLLENLDFLMYNNHPILGTVRPIVPASLALGFVHIEPPKPLTQDLENYFQQSKNGVIYFSLGSNVKSSELSTQTIKILCEAFRQLDYDILWKWETEDLEYKPANVKINMWLPQQDILAQKKVKLFITQGGQQSFEEAITHGVPLLVFPFLGDQYFNSQRVVRLKVGLTLEINKVTSEEIQRTLKELLTNNSYKENMKKLSEMAKDQPMTSLESAVWWTEYVIRHKGAKHLHAKDKDLPLYQFYFLDMAAVSVVLLCLVVLVLRISVKFLLSLFNKYLPEDENLKAKKKE